MSLDTTPDKKIVKVSLTFLFIRGSTNVSYSFLQKAVFVCSFYG